MYLSVVSNFSFCTALVFSSCLQKRLISLIGLRETYLLGLAAFAASMLLTVASGTNVLALNVLAAVSGVGFAVVTQFVISVNSAVKNCVEFLSDHDDPQQPHHHVQGRPGGLLQGPDTR